MSSRRPSIIVPILICIFTIGALARSPGLAAIRGVDAVLLVATGLLAGVALGQIIARRD
ncbi:MAG: hypothetical protein ABI639_17185 [Thermoanaerobaculia bacterium]